MADLNNPDDVRLTKLNVIPLQGTGNPVDITGIMLEMHIYEDMYKPFVTGTIAVYDTIGFRSKLPINGEEYLEVSWETPGGDVQEHEFYIYKISGAGAVGDNGQSYILSFASHEMMANAGTTMSYGFDGELLSDMATKIYEESIKADTKSTIEKVFDSEPTLTPRRMSFPAWSPAKIIREMTKTAQSAAHPTGADYKFWEDLQGFHFRSIQSLIFDIEPIKDSEQRERLHWTPNNSGINLSAMNQAIEHFNILNSGDTVKKLTNGTLASRMINFNPVTGAVENIESDVEKVFAEIGSMEAELPFTAEAKAALMKPASFLKLHINDASEAFPSGAELFSQTQDVQNGLFGNVQIELQLPGNSNRKIGQIAELRLPQNGARETEGLQLDRQLSGNVMITAINHAFVTGSKYKQIIKVVKDSSFEPMEPI